MKNFIFISLSLLVTVMMTAQTSFHLDTIYANDQKNVALFFPEPIRQGITGSENYAFTYNREKGQYFGLLQAKPGKESNLLVVNKNGAVFSYIVKYRKKLNRLNYFIPTSKSIGNEKPLVADSTTIAKREDTIDNRTFYYNKFCSYLIGRKKRIGRIKKRNEGIVLRVENIIFDKEELYFVIQVENKSSLDYDLNFLKLSVETRKKGNKKSLQRLYQEPIFKYNLPSKVKENKSVRLVYVLPKFSIGNDRRAVLELNEKNGERNLKLKISHRFINNPN
ncbi:MULTISPECIES: DUF4138 domain-containing protein [Mesonia]|uniref:Uncharacterized protein n=1 Tax=Mesonia oceanica TaxID=2687242 RepID=A0AC61YAE8_9FLAO|nr:MULTISPECIES: DUF4138 domain-containing protein [Mesonia]MBJ98754.1 conjugal transfer protein TraN [Flavobacteriaceae bacterium]MAN28242.1 conjugal transfer protein TraN [Mesonia sp.]MAQ40040.1 conjugal transfer protein TraN [Mesonia sp.]MAQ42613.1 conjugal transfer protein TraN [Mesonia sp.]VVV00848.1 hypothetical protein FVB9532_02124 [Mesonia oceanica]|tara:strand:+ start:2386 stop:3219 length:834 start_codon:yes stop_codon:yes gene_type:complete